MASREKKFITAPEKRTGYQTEKTHMTYEEVKKRALKLLKKGDPVSAEKDLNFLLEENENDLEILYYLAGIELFKNHISLAKIIMDKIKAVHDDPDSGNKLDNKLYSALINNYGYIYTNRQEKTKARECFIECLKIKGQDADVLANLGALHINEGNPDKGLYYLKRAMDIEPTHPQARWNAGLCYLEKGIFGKGFDLYEAGYETGDRIERNYEEERTPFWDGEEGSTVVVYGEQGMGDEIMYASMLPDLAKKCNVVFECHPRLANIFKNSFDFPVYGTRKAKRVSWPSIQKFDTKISIASLGKYFRRHREDFPKLGAYLKPDEELKELYKKKLEELGDKPKIGISWEGGIAKTASTYRSIPLEQWKELFDVDATFISLQYTPDAKEEAEEHGLVHWQEAIDDYDHTAALVSNLDLVISVCTSIIHLSGALDVPCWVLTPSKPAWRYGIKGEMVWYDSVKLYRQRGDWSLTFDDVKGDLCKLLQTNTASSTKNSTKQTMSMGQAV